MMCKQTNIVKIRIYFWNGQRIHFGLLKMCELHYLWTDLIGVHFSNFHRCIWNPVGLAINCRLGFNRNIGIIIGIVSVRLRFIYRNIILTGRFSVPSNKFCSKNGDHKFESKFQQQPKRSSQIIPTLLQLMNHFRIFQLCAPLKCFNWTFNIMLPSRSKLYAWQTSHTLFEFNWLNHS